MKARAAIILIQNDKIALIERHRQGLHYFAFPGGKIEAGETPAQTAMREAEEELGLKVKVSRMVAEVWYLGSPQYYFLAEAMGGRFGHGSGAEMTSSLETKKGIHLPVWMELVQLVNQPVLPKLMASYVYNALKIGWPGTPLVVTDQPLDETGQT